MLLLQQQQLVAIDNCRTLISCLLRHMALLSSSSAAAVALQQDDRQATLRRNDAAVLFQSGCSRASSSSSLSSERHMTSSADSGHSSSLAVINDVMNVTSEDNYASFVDAVVAFIKVCLYAVSAVMGKHWSILVNVVHHYTWLSDYLNVKPIKCENIGCFHDVTSEDHSTACYMLQVLPNLISLSGRHICTVCHSLSHLLTFVCLLVCLSVCLYICVYVFTCV